MHQFFKDLSDIVNIASAPSKRHDELQKAQAAKITHLVSINELATGTGMNPIGTLQRPCETGWSSYLNSVTSLLKMYNATSTEAIGITSNLCQALQRRSQDILNDMSLVLTTKDLIKKLKDDGWNELLKNVLLTLTTTLDPKEFFKLFDIDKICILVNKFYPEDFSQEEKERLPYELKCYEEKERLLHELKCFELDVCKHPDLRKILTFSELCKSLGESGKSVLYPLVDKLIVLY
ncbi:hypothetical protein CXB51_014548 [Gossypium anomalum]|uniref:Uncharacterized protein n=1 Tax=Gossypium anomalum TaxID=47600 RepID=A0A8J6D4V6_9ROSI|nr:hypothetical protein CXB51_014548 [Gossypium anomalum]